MGISINETTVKVTSPYGSGDMFRDLDSKIRHEFSQDLPYRIPVRLAVIGQIGDEIECEVALLDAPQDSSTGMSHLLHRKLGTSFLRFRDREYENLSLIHI